VEANRMFYDQIDKINDLYKNGKRMPEFIYLFIMGNHIAQQVFPTEFQIIFQNEKGKKITLERWHQQFQFKMNKSNKEIRRLNKCSMHKH
jgi:hypothetical protein